MMAISAFRTVRRRRQVWLRSSYGTEEYYRDADDRRHRVEQTDKQTILGKLRNSLQKKRDRWLSERVQRKLKKAEHRFQQRRFQFQKLQQYEKVQNSDMRAQTEHDGEHDYMSQHTIPDYDDWSESETSSVTSFTTNNNTLSNSTLNLLLDDAYGGHRLKFGDKVEDNDEDYEDDESDGNSISSSMTKNSNQRLDAYRKHKRKSPKSSKMLMTITRDEVSFASGPIKNLPYVHGGFFGAAPFMLADPHWIDILRHLMPDVYVELSHRVLHTSVSKLILWAENNPVVAAYGTAYEILNHSSQKLSKPERKSKRKKESKQRVIATTLEWDIFLDPHLVHNLETVLKHRDKFLDKENNLKQKDPLPSATIDGNTTENSKEMKIKKSKTESILLSFQHEIQRRARLLVENMLIAHGNLNQLFLEQCGFFKQYNFSRVKRTRRTLGGGIFATNWCAIYAEALQIGLQKNHQGDKRKTVNDKSFHNISTPQYDEKLIEIPSAKYSFDGNPSNQNSSEDSDKECYDSDDTISCQSMSSIESVRNAVDSSVSIDERRLKNLRSKQKQKEKQKISGMNILPNFDEQKNNEIPGSSFNMLRQNRELKRSFSSTSLNELALNTCPTWSISESISLIKDIMKKYHNDQSDHDESNENEYVPLRLLLDLKSRHIPKRVLALVVDTLEETGIQVDGIASFIIDEIRDISQYCTSPVNEIYFFHSAGEIQAACHNGLLKNCCCYFNAGNLFWEKPESIGEYIRLGSEIFLSAMTLAPFDADQAKKSYKFQSFSRINKVSRNDELHLHDHDKDNDINMNNFNHIKIKSSQKNVTINYEKDFESDGDSCSTIQEYKDHYNLSIGLYVQEFAIDASAISLITQYVNENPHVYELGLSWGGINGLTVGGIQPGRVTNTDGFWNQRYGGVRWNSSKHPGNVDHPHH